MSLSRASGRRALVACAALGSALLLVTCTGEPVAPGVPRLGQLSIAPIWPDASRLGGLVLDNIRLTVVRPPADTIARVARTFAPATTQLQLTVPVLLQGASENLQVTLELFAGTTLLFSGTQTIGVGVGGGGSPIQLPVTFTGPGTQVASLTLQPRDTTISAGAQLAFAVTAQDSQQAPVTLFYTTWTSSGSAVTIDGAGVATAGAGRGTVTITAVTPSGARDSTTLTVAPPGTQLVKISGDNQSASVLSPLPLPLVVEVRAADNLPVPGATVTFAVLSGGGTVDSATATTDAAGQATTGATLGATVGAQSFSATAAGTNTVTFSATGTSGGVRVWTGTVDGNWNTAGNWSPATVPTAGDSVVVVAGTPNDPDLTGNATLRALTLQGNSAALTVSGNLTVSGSVALPDTFSFIEFNSGQFSAGSVTLAGFQAFVDASTGGATISGATSLSGDQAFVEVGVGSAIGAVTITGNAAFFDHGGGTQGAITASGASAFWEADGTAVTVTGAPAIQLSGTAFASSFGPAKQVTVNGSVTIGGTGAFLDPGNGDHWTINGDLQTTGGGTLQMTATTDTVEVNGNATFGGGDESTRLTAGALLVSGNFAQTGLATSFVGTGTHSVFLDGSGTQTINFQSPGFAQAHFQNVIVANSAGGVIVSSNVFTAGTAGVIPLVPRILSGSGQTLFTTNLNVSNFTLNNLLLNFTGSTVLTFDTVTFQGYAPTATPLTIVHPGAVTPLPFQDIVFTVVPTTGFYIDATDSNPSDGVPLVIDMLNPTPASPGGRVQTAGGATINWAGVGPIIWTGTTSTNWSVGTNWSGGAVPTNADDVVIPSGGNQPSVTASCSAQSLTVNVGATLGLNAINCQVGGNVFADGSITGSGSIQIATTALLRGNVPNLILSGPVTLAGRTVVAGGVTMTGASGDLILGGGTMTVAGSFVTQSSATLTMTNGLDSLVVSGAGIFGGGFTGGKLTAGYLKIGGSFSQTSGTSTGSFVASGTHKTELGAAAVRVVNFASPGLGAGTSQFNNLEVTLATGGLSLATNTFLTGQLISHPTGATPLISVTAGPKVLTVGGVNVSRLTIDQNVMTIGAGTITQFDTVSFTGQANGVTQLTFDNPGAAAPFSFTALSFAVTPTTGHYLTANDFDGAAPDPLTINMVNASPAAPSPSLFTATNGAVVNWPGSSPVVTWTGAVSTDWSNAANWSPAQVPSSSNDVVVPATTNKPLVTSSCAAKSILVNSGGQLDLGAFDCQVQGNVNIGGTSAGTGSFQLLGAGQVQGNLRGLIVNAPVSLSNIAAIIGNLTITGVGSSFSMNGFSATVAGNLSTQGAGLLIMTNAADNLNVQGSAAFDGGNELGQLSAGLLLIGGNLTQAATSSADAFHTSGTHLTEFTGASPTLTFATPGNVPGSSHFEQFRWSGAGTMTLASDVFAHGTMDGTPGVTGTIASINHKLQVGGFVGGGATFDGTQLVIDQPLGAPIALDNVTFTNMSSTVNQLTVNHPGIGGPFAFTNLTFSAAPTTGFYISANDLDGPTSNGPLTIDVTGSAPAAGAPFIQLINGAIVNWPAAAPLFTWTGATDANWTTGTNWSTGTAPTATDNALIPAGTPSMPALNTNTTINDLTVQAGATLSANDITLDVNGIFTFAGSFVGCCGDFIGLNGGGTISGTFDQAVLSVSPGAVVTLSGNTTMTSSSVQLQGELIIGGHSLDLGQGSLTTMSGTGLLTMTSPADLVLAGFADFSGGDETGHLTAGLIQTQSLTQGNGGSQHPSSFFGSGNHRVALGGPSPSFVTIANPASSRFQDLDLSGVSATLTLNSNVTVAGQLISTQPSANGPVISGSGFTLTAGGADVVATGSFTALTFDGVPLVLSGGAIPAFSHVLFANQNPLGIHLTVNNVGQGSPFTFSNLSFTTGLSAGGLYIQANDLDGPTTNGPLTIDVLGANPATGAGVSQANNGAVINWPPTGGSFTWTGAVSSDWSNPGNWDLGTVPGVIDDVILVPITNQPVLTAGVGIHNLTSTAGSILDVGTFVLSVGGFVDLAGAINGSAGSGVVLAGTGGQLLRGTISTTVAVAGSYLLNGNLVVTGDFSVDGTLDLSGFNLTVNGNFVTIGAGVLVMTTTGGFLDISGDAIFSGGNTSGLLTAGTIRIAGNFTQVSTNSAQSFAASPGHLTEFSGNPVNFLFTTPGVTASHFGDLSESGFGAQFVLGSDMTILGFLSGGDGFGGSFLGNNCPVTLTVTQWNNSVSLDCVQLIIDDPAGVSTGMSDVQFLNLPTNVTQLTIRHPGTAAGNFSAGTINVVPLSGGDTGHYIDAVDLDGNAPFLVVDIFNSNVLNGPAFTTTSGGANVLWQNGTLTWTGAVDNNWFLPGNWDLLAVPSSFDSVVIPTTSLNPSLIGNAFVGAVNITGGNLTLNGNTLNVARTFATTGTGTITMNSFFSQLVVSGDILFAGGSTSGLLGLGRITVGGNFAQSAAGGSATSFAPSLTHTTDFTSAAPQSIAFASPGAGPGGAHFAALDLTGATGGVTLSANLSADSLFSTSTVATLNGAGHSLTARRVQVSGLLVNNAPIVIDEQGSASTETFSNVTFQGFPGTNTTMLMFLGPGGTVSARPLITTDNITFQSLGIGANNFYVDITASSGIFITFNMNGSNQGAGAGGNGPTLTKTTGGTVTVNWP
ncbi:MAG: hypothetical protein ABI587_15290 [Gemmatimonadales bacterium]